MKTFLQQPADPYDTQAWLDFYAENPGFRRSVGAAGVNDDPADSDPDPDPANPDPDPDIANPEPANSDPADPADPDPADPAGPADPDPADSKTSDKEAELLRDLMKHKKAAKDAKDALKNFDGIDVEEYKRLKQEKQDTERKELEAKGNFEEVKRQILEAHDSEITTFKTQLEEKDGTIAQLQSQIEELTVGSNFGSSKFLTEQTLLPPSKARTLYGSHFEIEDGKVVAYDKPKGDQSRSPLVDGRGNPLPFESAIEKIVKADPDSKDLLRANMKPGADSSPSNTQPAPKPKPMSTQDKIKSGLGSLIENTGDDGFKTMFENS